MLLSNHYNNMYRIANIVSFVLAIFVVTGCSCSKILCERNIQDEIPLFGRFATVEETATKYG